ncbi:hypothetical protein [Marinoscillum furvescens]|uniref:Lipoprotein n=1 Tax=Marinoscillum furvescens DSM 4134 TaxID=1122208 RepID=A0A3D9L271_MARFU|nr:hypothetical protein [Marinoscillum furvescens]RED97484.1 hypothetical protein C7460_11294 [Marinoscillum furvescens DSM 4134]
MRKIGLILLTTITIGFYACESDQEATASLSVDEVAAEAAVATDYEDVDQVVEEGMNFFTSGGRVLNKRIIDCATVERDTVNKTITIDFGDGCEGPHGRVRKGKVLIEYNERRRVPGAYRIVTFDEFFIDSVQVEGTRTLTNTTNAEEADTYAFEVKLEGGKLTYPDGTTYTRTATKTRTIYVGGTRDEHYTSVSGSASGVQRNGESYSMEVLDPIIFKRGCRAGRVFIPVSGQKEIISGEQTILVDYGDGTCDNLVDITINGETETKEIKPRRRK